MKKRFMTKVVAAVTALAMSVSALAAGSIVGTIDMPNASTDKGTISLEPVAPGTYDDDLQKVVDEINDAKSSASVKAAFDGNLSSSLAYYTEKGLEVKGYDISGYKVPCLGNEPRSDRCAGISWQPCKGYICCKQYDR